MRRSTTPYHGLSVLLAVVAVAVLAGASSAPSPGSGAVSSVTVWESWGKGAAGGQPLVYPLAAVPARSVPTRSTVAPEQGGASDDGAESTGSGGPRRFDPGETPVGARSAPFVFGSAGADRCRLVVCVQALRGRRRRHAP